MLDGIIHPSVLENAITLKTRIPSLFVGRRLVVTVLSNTKGGKVLISMFGNKVYVETDLELVKGQVLHLEVHALRPRVVLKPVVQDESKSSFSKSAVDGLIERLIGSLGRTDIKHFEARKIFEQVLQSARHDNDIQYLVQALLRDLPAFAGAVAFFYIPLLVDKDPGGRARVAIYKEGDDSYAVNFDVDTDNLGKIRCTALMGNGLDIEIVSPSAYVVDLLRSHAGELSNRLTDMGLDLKRLEIMQRAISRTGQGSPEMDVLV